MILFGYYDFRISSKRTQEVTSVERTRLYKLLDDLPAFAYLQGDEYFIRYANRYFRERFGRANNKKCYEILFNLTQPCNECHISDVFDNKASNEGELAFPKGKFYQIYYYPFEDENKELLALSLGIDVTNRKKAEYKLKESEEKFRTIAEQSVMGILIVQDGVIKYANKSVSEINEFSNQEIMGWSTSDLIKVIHPDDRDIASKRLGRLGLGDEKIEPSHRYRMITKLKKLKWVSIYSRRIRYQNKEGILTTLIDITEKKEAEKLIVDELNKLKELDQIRNDLIRRISHEIRTPLISIYTTIILLLEVYKEEFSKKILDFIMIIKKGGERLKNLVDNLLDVYDIESKKLSLNLKSNDLVAILKVVVDQLEPQRTKRQHIIEMNLPRNLIVDVDYDRAKQIFMNLLINALKYTPPGGRISLQIVELNSYVDVIIKDIGVGFTELEKENLFRRFGKIERYGKGMNIDTEGPGLGLFIARELTHLHNGEIFLDSEGRNKGSKFIVRLYK